MKVNDIYTHYKNNLEYIIIDFCKIQENNEWVDGIIYKLKDSDNPAFVRTKKEFNKSFIKKENPNLILKQSKCNVLPHEKIILLHIKKKEYLVIHTILDYDEDGCYPVYVGDYEEYDDCDIEDTNFMLKDCELYNNFLFQEYLKNNNLI